MVLREEKMNYFNAGLTLGVTLFRSMSVDARLRGELVPDNVKQLVGKR